MDCLRVAVVGMGFIGMQHIDAIRRVPGVVLTAAAEHNAAALHEKGGYLGLRALYTDYREMIEKESIDVLHNCTPNAQHYDVNTAALEKGIHVYSEKPLSSTTGEAASLLRLAQEKGVAHAVNFNYRGNAMIREIQARLSSGHAGRCFLLHGSYLQDWLMLDEDYNWRIEEDAGSRAFADIGSHWFDLAQFIRNERITQVNASLFTAHPFRIKNEGGEKTRVQVRNEDGGTVMLRFADGAAAAAVVSQVSGGYKNSIALSVDCEAYSMRWQQQSADRLVIGKRNGGEEVLFTDSDLLSQEAKPLATLPPGHASAWADAQRNVINHFYQAVRGGTYGQSQGLPYATFADGLQIMKIVDACVKSAATEQWIGV